MVGSTDRGCKRAACKRPCGTWRRRMRPLSGQQRQHLKKVCRSERLLVPLRLVHGPTTWGQSVATHGMDNAEGATAEGSAVGEACADWAMAWCFIWTGLLGQGCPRGAGHEQQRPLDGSGRWGRHESG
jgi:hypothetical protein